MTERDKLLDKAFQAAKEHNFKCWLLLPTGVGKSSLLVRILKHLDPKTVVYGCDNSRLRDTDFPKELQKWGGGKYLNRMERVCYQTMYKWKDRKFDLGLFDEADYMTSPQYIKSALNNKFKHIILVSATLDGDKRKLALKIAPIAFERHIGEITNDGIINKEQIWFVRYDLTPDENKRYLSYNDSFRRLLNEPHPNRFKLEQLQLNRRHFLGTLDSAKNTTVRLLKDLYKDKNNKILIFCISNEQASKICKYTYHGGTEKDGWLDKFDEGEIRVLAVCGKVDRGANLVGVNNQIHVSPQRSKTKILQKTGRGRRLDIDDIVHLYFLIPNFIDRRGEKRPTIVQDYVMSSCKDMNLKDAKNYEFKES